MKLDDARRLADECILILGAPRSGTTWLAKIVDSHPDVLYRHEPDEISASRPDMRDRDQLAAWIMENGVRAATKRPFFQKSWLPMPVYFLHSGLAGALNVANRLVGHRIKLPGMYDFGAEHRKTTRAAIKLVGWDGGRCAEQLPETRTVFIIRHPCGTIASSLRGAESGQFLSEQLPQDEVRAIAKAGSCGISVRQFNQLSLASKLAWYWVAFNDAALNRFRPLPNVKIVVYEELCRDPLRTSKEIFAFLGISWNRQSNNFLTESSNHSGDHGYFTVRRVSIEAADKWKSTMKEKDMKNVMEVLNSEPALARYWS